MREEDVVDCLGFICFKNTIFGSLSRGVIYFSMLVIGLGNRFIRVY